MVFGDDFSLILPNYLVDSDKDRLIGALKQFTIDESLRNINYQNFYKEYNYPYFMQSDMVKEIRMAIWNEEKFVFNKNYSDAIIISNTCDISFENSHKFNSKQCLFAPLIDFQKYITDLSLTGYSNESLDQFIKTVKAQLVTNLFYLPVSPFEGKDYVVWLDRIFWFPVSELKIYTKDIQDNRITSLDQFGYYLFILKLSYHLCRLPEENDREQPNKMNL